MLQGCSTYLDEISEKELHIIMIQGFEAKAKDLLERKSIALVRQEIRDAIVYFRIRFIALASIEQVSSI